MKKLITFVFTALIILGCAQSASAHATPVSYEPDATSVVQKVPESVRIVFSERVEEKASDIIVYGPDGSVVSVGEAKLDPTDAHAYSISIKDGGKGTYTISWEVVSSDDGHFTKGAFAFSVGKATGGDTTLGQIQIQHISTIPQAVPMAIEMAGQAFILGVLFFLAFLWRPLRRKFSKEITPYKERVESYFSVITITGVIFILLGIISFVILKTFDLQQLRPGSFDATLKLFLSTVDGSYSIVRAILGVVLLVSFLILRKTMWKKESITKGEWWLFAIVFAMILIRARVSHAAASNFFPSFTIFVTAMQLFFKELWVGGLVVFSVAVAPTLLRLKSIHPFIYISTLFSKIMIIVFAGVGVTGAYVVWIDLKSPDYIFSTEWGSLFIILSMFGVALFAIRLYHQLLVEKSAVLLLQKGQDGEDKEIEQNGMVAWFGTTLKLEMLVGVALIFITSVIIITTPPYVTEKFNFEKSAISQDAKITMMVHPNEPTDFLITVADAKKNTEIPVSNMVVTITNQEKNIGPIVVNTEQRFIGGYAFPEALLTPAGQWKIDISAQRPNSYDAVASFSVNYPQDITASRVNPEKRSFGWFEFILVIISLLIMGLAWLFYGFSKKLHDESAKIIETKSAEEKNKENKKENWTTSSVFTWIGSLVGLLIIITIIWSSYDTYVKSDFEKLCQSNGHFWVQSIPMKDGQALSPDTVTGCFLDVGLYHFADEREYQFFYQRREIVPVFSYKPATLVAGVPENITVSLQEVKDGQNAGPITELGINHDRILHVLIVGQDLTTFAHIHPEDLGPITDEMKKTTTFPLQYTFPKAGHYALNLDYIVSGIEYTNVIIVDVSGSPMMPQPAYIVPTNPQNFTQTKDFDGYTVTFNAPRHVKAGAMVMLTYYIAKDGKPVTDLEPYLSAAMHIGIIRNDLGRFFHTHGEAFEFGSVWFQQILGQYFKYHMHFAPDLFGPRIISPPWYTKFTTPGVYTVFGEFKVEGKVIVTDFSVQVE